MVESTPPLPFALLELQQYPQWVCYNSNKVPIDARTGDGAKANDASTWTSYEIAYQSWKRNKYAGIGFEFLREQKITGVDLDKCIDETGQISDYAKDIVLRLNSYTEKSPSGRGLHILVKGIIPKNLGPDGLIEVYDHLHYFTVTGDQLPGSSDYIEDRQAELLTIYQETVDRRQASKQVTPRLPQEYKPIANQDEDTRAYGQKALDEEYQNITTAVNGTRNSQLNRSAYSLGQLVGSGILRHSEVEDALTSAAARAGLSAHEIQNTLQSGLAAGMKQPRDKPTLYLVTPPATEKAASNGTKPPDSDIWLADFDADDSGNGDALNALYGQDYLWCSSRGWYRYTGTHWELDVDGAEVRKSTVETLRRRRHAAVEADREAVIKCCKADEKRVTGAVSRFKTLSYAAIDAFDSNPNHLNCKNGVVDLRTGQIVPHDRNQRFTYCLPVPYGNGDSSPWIDYLAGVVGGGQEVIDYLQMLCGYSLTGHTREEILVYLHGPTRSGKGTFSETFMNLLGAPLAASVDFNSFTAKREGDVSNFDLAPLKPARMIFASESQRDQSLNPAKIKQLTGGDEIRCCFKHRDHFAYRPQFKVWMLSNWPVNGDPEDDALWGRVRVIQFPNSYLGKEDKSKKAKLKDPQVLQGVLHWAVEGAKKWYALGDSGLSVPESVKETTQGHRNQLDYVQQWLDACGNDLEDGWTANEVVTASYLAWCKSNGVQHPKSPKGLAQSLKTKGYEPGVMRKINGKAKRGVVGLHIFSDEEN